jgi:hypothetical protein
MFELAIKAASVLISSADLLDKLGKVRREKLATYFDEIAKVMRDYVETIDKGEDPPPLCQKLAVLAQNIRDVTAPVLESDKVDSLVNQLENACSNWKKLDRSNKTDNDILKEILSTAGSFEAEAIVLRAK